jgi:hypothetical protein
LFGLLCLILCPGDEKRWREMGVPVGGWQEVPTAIGQLLIHRREDFSQETDRKGGDSFFQDKGSSVAPTPRHLALSYWGCFWRSL